MEKKQMDIIQLNIGDMVIHSEYGTKGKVFEFLPEGDIGIEWDNGGQAYYGKYHHPISMIKPCTK